MDQEDQDLVGLLVKVVQWVLTGTWALVDHWDQADRWDMVDPWDMADLEDRWMDQEGQVDQCIIKWVPDSGLQGTVDRINTALVENLNFNPDQAMGRLDFVLVDRFHQINNFDHQGDHHHKIHTFILSLQINNFDMTTLTNITLTRVGWKLGDSIALLWSHQEIPCLQKL